MAQDVIVRGVTYTGVEKLSLPVSGGSALFRDTSDADAVAGDVLSGKKAYNANGEINGSMPNQGAVSGTISDKDTPFQIPQGYHNGSGSVEIAATDKALLVPGNIRDSVTILGVTGNYTGGGGGPTSADAILIVTAPSGSTVTATKGGTTLSPTLWTTAADANFECALFVIGSSLFDAQNPWTVTATLGTDTDSKTVTVNNNKQYDVELSYNLYLVKNGIDIATFAFSGASGSYGTDTYSVSTPGGGYGCAYCSAEISDFSTLYIEITDTSQSYTTANLSPYFGLCAVTPTISNHLITNMVAKTEFPGQNQQNHRFIYPGTYSLDVSSYTGVCYIGMNFGGWSGAVGIITIKNLWLE